MFHSFFIYIITNTKPSRDQIALFVGKKDLNSHLGTVLHDHAIVSQIHTALNSIKWPDQEGDKVF